MSNDTNLDWARFAAIELKAKIKLKESKLLLDKSIFGPSIYLITVRNEKESTHPNKNIKRLKKVDFVNDHIVLA